MAGFINDETRGYDGYDEASISSPLTPAGLIFDESNPSILAVNFGTHDVDQWIIQWSISIRWYLTTMYHYPPKPAVVHRVGIVLNIVEQIQFVLVY